MAEFERNVELFIVNVDKEDTIAPPTVAFLYLKWQFWIKNSPSYENIAPPNGASPSVSVIRPSPVKVELKMEILLEFSVNISPPVSALLSSNVVPLMVMLLYEETRAPPIRTTPVTSPTRNQLMSVVSKIRALTPSIAVPNWFCINVQSMILPAVSVTVSAVPESLRPSNVVS